MFTRAGPRSCCDLLLGFATLGFWLYRSSTYAATAQRSSVCADRKMAVTYMGGLMKVRGAADRFRCRGSTQPFRAIAMQSFKGWCDGTQWHLVNEFMSCFRVAIAAVAGFPKLCPAFLPETSSLCVKPSSITLKAKRRQTKENITVLHVAHTAVQQAAGLR